MKTALNIILYALLVFPLSNYAQQQKGGNYHTSFSADNTTTCGSSLKVSFTQESVLQEGDFISHFSWLFGDGGSSNDSKPAYLYTKPGVYTVKLIIQTHLGFTYTHERVDYISVRGEVFVNLGNDTSILEGASIVLDAANQGASYFWNTGDTTQKITVSKPGQYWVVAKKGECESRDRINVLNKLPLTPQAGFVASETYTCGSALKVFFRDEAVLEEGDFISRWTWIFGDGSTTNDSRPGYDYTRPGLYTVKLIIQTDRGHTYTSERTNYIFIEGKVYANLGNDTAIDKGTSLLLDAGNPGAVYNWSTGERTQKITVTEPGDYWVLVTKDTCYSGDHIIVTFKSTPRTSFEADITSTCGSSLKVNFKEETILNEGDFISHFTWLFGDGGSSNDSKPGYIYTKPGLYTVKLILQTHLGFTYTAERINYISVKGDVYVNLGNDTSILEGASIVLDAGSSGATYLWSTGETTQKITVSRPGQYWVVAKKGECESTDRINITNNTPLVPGADFNADITVTCGSSLKVNFKEETVLEEGDFISRFTWVFGDGGSSNDWRPAYTYSKPGLYTVKLIIQTHFGFTYTEEKEDYIVVNGDAYVNLGNDTSIIAGASLVLDAGNPGSVYFWNTGETTRKITVTKPGQYWVRVKKGDCESTDRINVTNNTTLVPSASFVADTTTSCNSSLKVNFKDEAILEEGDFISRWTWVFGDGNTSNDSRPGHEYTKPGLYTVKLTIQTDHGFTYTAERVNYISVTGEVYVNLGNDTVICEESTIELNAGNPGATYSWSTGATTQKITVSEPGVYLVRVIKNNCESVDAIQIATKPPLFPNFGFNSNGNCLPVNTLFADSSTACGDNKVVKWLWSFGDGTTSSQQHPAHIYTINDTFLVRLTIWDMNGFSVTRSKRVVVNAAQAPFVNLGKDTTACEVEPVILDAGNPGAAYTWSTGENNQTCVVTNSGQLWVRVEQSGCISSDTIQVSLIPTLNPKFGFTSQTANCPSAVAFRDSSLTCGVTINQWHWDFGDGSTSTVQHPLHTFLASGEYIVRMTIWDNIGNSVTKSKRVVIESNTSLVNLGKDTTICFGELLVISAGNPGASYLWSTGEITQEITVQDDGTYWVRVYNGGCVGYDTINVKTAFPIIPSFEYTMNGNCLPVDVKFQDMSTVRCNQRIVQWRWDFGDGTTSSEQHPLHTYTRSDSFAIRLTVTSNNGTSISKSRKIFIKNIAPVVSLGNDLTICKGESIQLDAGISNATYLWTPESSLDDKAIQRPMASPLQTTTYMVAVTKCMTTVTDQVIVFVNPLIQPTISTNGKSLVSSKANGYQWYKNNEVIQGATNRSFDPVQSGYYTVRAINTTGCQAISTSYPYIANNSKKTWTNGIKIKCSPNPSPGIVYLQFSQLPLKPVGVKVINRYGQPLFATTISNYTNRLNLSMLAKGHYTIELILENEKVSIPVLIQ